MVKIYHANDSHVQGIIQVCSEGYRATYAETHTEKYIERIINEFYNEERVVDEISNTSRQWGGYFVAVEDQQVIGAGAGGMIDETSGEVFVLYIHPERRNEGIGSMLLDAITTQQKEAFNATEQWVSVQKGNVKGTPFYEAKGFTVKREQNGYGNAEGEHYISLRYYRPI